MNDLKPTTIQPETKLTAAPPCVLQMPMADYHASPGVSKSQLDNIHKSPALVEWAKNAPDDPDAVAAVDIGSAIHTLLLEPDSFHREYVVDFTPPPGAIVTVDELKAALYTRGISYKSSASKAVLTNTLLYADPDAPVSEVLREQWELGINGRHVLTVADHKKLLLMRDSVMAHPTARRLLEAEGHTERCHFWVDEVTGELCRCRIDREIPKFQAVLDVKSTAEFNRWERSAKRYRYHVQQCFYTDGFTATQGNPPLVFAFLVVSTTRERRKFPVDVKYFERTDLESAALLVRQDMASYVEARRSGVWTGMTPISMPIWD